MQPSTGYTLGFAAAICVFCSIFVAGSAVALKDKQDANKVLDRQKKVLSVAGFTCVDEMSPEEIETAFNEVKPVLVDMSPDKLNPVMVDDIDTISDIDAYSPRKAAKDPATNLKVDTNPAKVAKMARYEVVYYSQTRENPCPNPEAGTETLATQLIVPIQGPGLWSTLYGYVSLTGTDFNTVNGLIFYEHAETPGLGGEVDNPKWKAKWVNKVVRKKPSSDGPVNLKVVKGTSKDEYGVDGLSGATITSNGVSLALDFWLGKTAFSPTTLAKISNFVEQEGIQ